MLAHSARLLAGSGPWWAAGPAAAASKAAAAAARPGLSAGLAPFSSSRIASKIKGEELFGQPIEDVEKAFSEEHKKVEEPVLVNLETEHTRVEDQEVPMLSSMFESHTVPQEALSAEEAAAEVERLRKLAPPAEGVA